MSSATTPSAVPDFTPDDLPAAGAVSIEPDPGYSWPAEARTRQALERWMDLKVGVLLHWGVYASFGKDGSWSLHRERLGDFTDPVDGWSGSPADYHSWYEDQIRTFSGEDFDASEWADVLADAGVRYLVLTSKHHDGFALYDTAYSNYKSTSEKAGLGRDFVAEVFDAFRDRTISTGIYFSKADWHHPGYWDRGREIADRFHNYDIAEQPKKWESFVQYTHNQVEELLTNYGQVDVLWLDAGWVRAPHEPIDIDRLARRARELQPDVLVVDREVPGPEENYRTPEQQVPMDRLDHPWESCITLTRGWCSMHPDDPAKPLSEIVSNLVRIVGRGGNYLIGVGPDGTGAMPPQVRERLHEIGDVLRVVGDAVYGTRPAPREIRVKGDIEVFPLVRADDPDAILALGFLPDGVAWPLVVRLGTGSHPVTGSWSAELFGNEGSRLPLECRNEGGEVVVTLDEPSAAHVVAVRFVAHGG